jgi:DNA-binding Xre family transcriptional regulator
MNTNKYVESEDMVTVGKTKFLCEDDVCDSLSQSMIRLIIKEVAMKEGIITPFDLSHKTGIPYESCRLMWGGETKRIDLKSIERICTVLGVRPGQLFEFEPLREEIVEQPKKGASKKAKNK